LDLVSVDEKPRDVPRDGIGQPGKGVDLEGSSDADHVVGVTLIRLLQKNRKMFLDETQRKMTQLFFKKEPTRVELLSCVSS
jgi:hypothetical protein